MPKPVLAILAMLPVLAVAACAGIPSSSPSPSSPSPSSASPSTEAGADADPGPGTPATSLTEAALPVASDMYWHTNSDWQVDSTTPEAGVEQVSVCQATSWESLGAETVLVRRYSGLEDTQAAALALGFPDEEHASDGYRTISSWLEDCGAVLGSHGIESRQTIPAQPVEVGEGTAQVSEWAYADSAGPHFESQGLIQRGDRVEIIVMTVNGQDNNWDLEAGGPVGAIHPMVRTIPPASERLGS